MDCYGKLLYSVAYQNEFLRPLRHRWTCKHVFSWIYHENLNAFIVKLYANFKIQFLNILVFLKECNMFVKESLF